MITVAELMSKLLNCDQYAIIQVKYSCDPIQINDKTDEVDLNYLTQKVVEIKGYSQNVVLLNME